MNDNGRINSIPNHSGIYRVCIPKDFNLQIKAETDAIKRNKGKTMLYEKEKLEEKFRLGDGKILYIGKASKGKGRGLQKRITEFVKYGYGECNNHRGGRAIWQIENNKNLILEYEECDGATDVEKKQIEEYKEKYGVLPFANWRL